MNTIIISILVLSIVALIVINYQRGILIRKLTRYADRCESAILKRDARIERLLDRCDVLALDLRIARNEIVNIGSEENPIYASDMFSDPSLFGDLTEEFTPSGDRIVRVKANGNHKYAPVLTEGLITYSAIAEESKTEEKSTAKTPKSNGNKDQKSTAKTPKSKAQPESKLNPEETAFYELVDLIMADRKVKKLPTDQFEWVKTKYPLWLKSPADQAEYKRRFDNRFPA